jgi:hypothetical protein
MNEVLRGGWKLAVLCAVLLGGAAACKPLAEPLPSDAPATPSLWNAYDPRDAALAELVIADGDSLAIDPKWPVQSIEYVYKWWGLAKPIFDHQLIRREGGEFRKDDQSIKAEDVAAFLASIKHLYPVQLSVGGNAWTDDYPSWSIEITGEDGRRVLLTSSSTGNAGDGPWNVLFNGRQYAQYDGSLAEPLGQLFQSQRGQPAALFYPGGRVPDAVTYSVTGRPGQLVYGFNGLLPIADGFRYRTNVVSGTLEGLIEGRGSIGGYGHMVIGTIDRLHHVTLTGPETVDCAITPIDTPDPSGALWEFSCPLPAMKPGTAYRFAISIEFGTDQGDTLTTTGELFGRWGEIADVLLTPPPAEIGAALAADATASDLLRDHILAYTLYQSVISTTGPYSGTQTGEVILLGQAAVGGQTVRYTVGTPFAVQDGQLTEWTLTRAALQQLVQDVGRQPLAQRIFTAVPTATLNLWYAEAVIPAQRSLINYQPRPYQLEIGACGEIRATRVPTTGQPLRAFGFNADWAFGQADFVLIDGQALVNDLDLMPNRDDRGGVLSLLMPAELQTGDTPPFERVWLQSASYNTGRPRLTLWVPEQASVEAQARYDAIAAALPVTVDKSYDTLWETAGLTFVVTGDGQLAVQACSK